MDKIKELTRSYTLSMSVTPFLIALVCAMKSVWLLDLRFLVNSILLFAGIVLVHLAVNAFDDYLDVKSKLTEGLKLSEIDFKSQRKAKTILSGDFTLEQVEKILAGILFIALIIGIYFTFLRGPLVIVYMLIAGILSAFYPVSSRYGLSELIVGIVFGPLLVNSSYFVLTGNFNPVVFCISFAVGLITTVLLMTHSLMDYEHDICSNKKTIPVLLENKNLAINFITAVILVAYFILIAAVLKYKISAGIAVLPILATLHLSVILIKSLYDYVQIKNIDFVQKLYLGPMENWKEIKQNNFAYFMYRFYIARNLAVVFNVVLAVTCAAFLELKTGASWIYTIYRHISF